MTFVVDASVALSWCFQDERTEAAENLLRRLQVDGAVVPSVWALEIANALLVAERRSRLSPAQANRYVQLLLSLSISVDSGAISSALGEIRSLGLARSLSAYDASYLDLAVRRGLPLATFDTRLTLAARTLGVPVLT